MLLLNRLKGWTHVDIAKHLGVSVSTVQKDLKTALEVCLAMAQRIDRS